MFPSPAALQTRIDHAVDMLERARDRADRNDTMATKLNRREIRALLRLIKEMEAKLNEHARKN